MTAEVMDLREVVDWFRTDTDLAVTRRPPGAYLNGMFVPGTPAAVTVTVSHVQPAGPRDMLSLPEGQRTEEAIAIFVKSPDVLYVADEPSGRLADKVTYAGKTWEVQHIYDYEDVAGYYHALATKVDLT